VNDLDFVYDVVERLAEDGIDVWVFGGWSEQLLGIADPRRHVDVDLLYPARDFSRVDRFIGADEIDLRPHKRSFELDGVPVELLLVQRDEDGWYTELKRGRHRWPDDVFATAGRLPVASVAALEGYRHSRRVDRAA